MTTKRKKHLGIGGWLWVVFLALAMGFTLGVITVTALPFIAAMSAPAIYTIFALCTGIGFIANYNMYQKDMEIGLERLIGSHSLFSRAGLKGIFHLRQRINRHLLTHILFREYWRRYKQHYLPNAKVIDPSKCVPLPSTLFTFLNPVLNNPQKLHIDACALATARVAAANKRVAQAVIVDENNPTDLLSKINNLNVQSSKRAELKCQLKKALQEEFANNLAEWLDQQPKANLFQLLAKENAFNVKAIKREYYLKMGLLWAFMPLGITVSGIIFSTMAFKGMVLFAALVGVSAIPGGVGIVLVALAVAAGIGMAIFMVNTLSDAIEKNLFLELKKALTKICWRKDWVQLSHWQKVGHVLWAGLRLTLVLGILGISIYVGLFTGNYYFKANIHTVVTIANWLGNLTELHHAIMHGVNIALTALIMLYDGVFGFVHLTGALSDKIFPLIESVRDFCLDCLQAPGQIFKDISGDMKKVGIGATVLWLGVQVCIWAHFLLDCSIAIAGNEKENHASKAEDSLDDSFFIPLERFAIADLGLGTLEGVTSVVEDIDFVAKANRNRMQKWLDSKTTAASGLVGSASSWFKPKKTEGDGQGQGLSQSTQESSSSSMPGPSNSSQ